jgi:hypothetical protein
MRPEPALEGGLLLELEVANVGGGPVGGGVKPSAT